MNQSRKLELSKETLRCLDDRDLTGVVGGGGGNNNSQFGGIVGCISAQQANSCVCQSVACDVDIL